MARKLRKMLVTLRNPLAPEWSAQVIGEFVSDELCVHKHHDHESDFGNYAITHAPSGCRATPYNMTRKNALTLAIELRDGYSWDFTDPSQVDSSEMAIIKKFIQNWQQCHQ